MSSLVLQARAEARRQVEARVKERLARWLEVNNRIDDDTTEKIRGIIFEAVDLRNAREALKKLEDMGLQIPYELQNEVISHLSQSGGGVKKTKKTKKTKKAKKTMKKRRRPRK